ncbi:MAG TPA: hypothetical protein VNJ01_18125 [Bacteriovoracaceae bacterium]|nr:hypothetical protein [Bacteriovoracaceae bacterium]
MHKILLLISVVSFSAQAHIQIGTYKGQTFEGTECSVEFKSISFITSFKHPLAERVTVLAHGKSFVLQHPVKVDAASVRYDDESLETSVPFQGGAEFFKVSMSHTAGDAGPKSFTHLIHDWQTETLTSFTCEGLEFQQSHLR